MIDLEKYKADMARAREAGITFEAIRDIMNAHADDGPDGESFGRMVERIRELTLQTAERMAAEERAAVVAHLRERAVHGAGNIITVEDACTILADLFGRGEHRREEDER